jgi:hypothetical protein
MWMRIDGSIDILSQMTTMDAPPLTIGNEKDEAIVRLCTTVYCSSRGGAFFQTEFMEGPT